MKAKTLFLLMLLSLALWFSLAFADEGVWERVGSPSRLTMFYDVSACNINGTIWVFAAESSGTSYIWRSSDNGATWLMPWRSQVVDHYYKQIIMEPSNGQYGWALVPGYTDGDNSAGPYKTTDRGDNWNLTYYQTQHSKRFECLVVDPTDQYSRMAFMGTHTIPQISNTKLLKTENGGQTWSPYDTGIEGNGGVMDIALCEGSPQNLYCIFRDAGDVYHLYYSGNGGQNWNRIIGADGVQKVVVHPTNASYIFVVMENPPNQIKASTDGGATWTVPFQNYGNWGACHSIKFTQLAGYENYAYFAFNSMGDDGNYHWLVRKNYDPTDLPVELPLSGRIPGDRRAISVGVDPNVPSRVFVGCQNMFYYSDNIGDPLSIFHEQPGIFPLSTNKLGVSLPKIATTSKNICNAKLLYLK